MTANRLRINRLMIGIAVVAPALASLRVPWNYNALHLVGTALFCGAAGVGIFREVRYRDPSNRPIYRANSALIFGYAAMAVLQWANLMCLTGASQSELLCGNAIADPYLYVVDYFAPTAVSATLLARRCIKTCHWPYLAITALLVFTVTSGCLAYEGYLLEQQYGLDIRPGIIWWPRF
jgi:hypothetical protein